MAVETIISVKRGGSPVAGLQTVPVRLVEISPIVIAGSGGAIPYNSLTLYSRVGVPDIRQGDLLTDTVSGATYRAGGTPIVHDMSYLSIQVEKNVQVTP